MKLVCVLTLVLCRQKDIVIVFNNWLISWLINFWSVVIAEKMKQVSISCFYFFQHRLAQKISGVDCWVEATAGQTLDSGGLTDDFLEPVDSTVEYYTPSLLSVQFRYCLILLECENKCESVCMLLH